MAALVTAALLLPGCVDGGPSAQPGARTPNPESPYVANDEPFNLSVVVEGVGDPGGPVVGATVSVDGGRGGIGTDETDEQGRADFVLERGQIIGVRISKPGWASIEGATFAIDVAPDQAAGSTTYACLLLVITCVAVSSGGAPNLIAASGTMTFHMAPDTIQQPWTGSVPLTVDLANMQTDWYPTGVKLAEDQATHDFYRHHTSELVATMNWTDAPEAAAALELGMGCAGDAWEQSTGDDSFAAPSMQGGSHELSWVPQGDGFLWWDDAPLECPSFQVGPIVQSSTGDVEVEGVLVAHLSEAFQRPDVHLVR